MKTWMTQIYKKTRSYRSAESGLYLFFYCLQKKVVSFTTTTKKTSGNSTISARNEAGGLFGAKVSGTLRVVAVGLCGSGEAVERGGKALKLQEKDKK